ncbi:MAG: hypothetical protein K6C94_00715 [Candidatus Gastranaerophilales bacterium]|nr:hypothetical protein [Candidatus Gastranaerophilales bacterium]
MGNFEFLEKVNPSIANLADTAEKLFRDEYYDQCIAQTRKMAEVMTRNVLGSKAQEDDSFDDMLYKLKTVSNNNFREQEFISDMYFLKKQGNIAVHSQKSENSGKIALECLEHVFEASVNYAYAITHSDKINKLIFDEKLLVLGEKNTNLQKEYREKTEEYEKQADNEKSEENFCTRPEPDKKPKAKQSRKSNLSNSDNVKTGTENNQIFFLKIFKISLILAVGVLLLLGAVSAISKRQSAVKPEKKTVSAVKVKQNAVKTVKPADTKYSITHTFSDVGR